MSLSSGDRFTAELSLTRGGTGSTKVGSETISVGPVTCEEGTRVQLKYLGQREAENMDISYAICLSKDAIDQEEYNEYLRRIIDILTPEGPPNPGSVTYVEIDEVDEDGIGYASPGGEQVAIGPVNAQAGDFVQVEGVTNTHARIIDPDIQGPNYDIRFWIISGQHQKLPLSIDDEYTTAVAKFEGEDRICYVKNIPIHLPDCEAELGQKLDVRISGFEEDTVVGEVLEVYDEVSRIKNPGDWARMQWLKEAGFEEPPLTAFATEFIGAPEPSLPTEPDRLKSAIVSEALRLCLADKAAESNEEFPRAHISGIRHWVCHKLEPVFGSAGNPDADWFREILDEGDGPTMTFLGDVIPLSHGYYATGQTRVVQTTDSTATLISGAPTQEFIDAGFNVEFRGLSRALVNTSEDEIEDAGLTIQSQEDYIGTDETVYDTQFLVDFISGSEPTEWQANESWEAYVGERGFGLTWGDEPLLIELDMGAEVSIWREPVEYGGDEYHLRLENEGEISGIRLPRWQYKQFCLILDAAAGTPRTVELLGTPDDDAVHLACTFSPPRSQYRWLTAIGADWRGFENDRIHWIVPRRSVESIVRAFDQLPVETFDDHTTAANTA